MACRVRLSVQKNKQPIPKKQKLKDALNAMRPGLGYPAETGVGIGKE